MLRTISGSERPSARHRLDAQEAGRGVVHAEDALVAVDGQNAFHHAREDGVALVPLPHDRGELVFQVGGHSVERLGQAADFFGIGGRKAMREVAAGEPLGVVAELFEGFDEAAGDDQAGDSQQRGRARDWPRGCGCESPPARRRSPPAKRPPALRPAFDLGRCGPARPHSAGPASTSCLDEAETPRFLSGSSASRTSARSSCLSIRTRRFVRVAHDRAVAEDGVAKNDDRESRLTALAELLAKGVDLGILLGCQERNDLVLGQAGPGFEVFGRAGEVEPPSEARRPAPPRPAPTARSAAWPDKVARTSVVCA